MDFKGIGRAFFILGLCVTLSDSKGNIWSKQNGNRWNAQKDVSNWSPEDSQLKDGGNWNPQNDGNSGRWNNEGWSARNTQSKENRWSPNDSQSKENSWSPNDSQSKDSGFTPIDAQVKDYDKWNANGNQQGNFRSSDAQSKDQWNPNSQDFGQEKISSDWNGDRNQPADDQSKDQWAPDSQAFGQKKISSGWDGNRGQQSGPWQPEDTQVKDGDNWGQVKIDDGPVTGVRGPDDDSQGNRNWGTGSGDQNGYDPNQGTGDNGWPAAGQGGDWPSNQNPGQEGTGPNQGGGDWSSGPGPDVGQGGDWPSNAIPGQDNNGKNQPTGNGDWSPGSGPSGGDDVSRPSIGDGPNDGDQNSFQGGPSISEGPTVGQQNPGELDSFPQGGDRGDTGSEIFPPRIPQGNYKGGDTPHPGDGAGQGRIEDSIPGTPGVDYPNYSTIPSTGFDCKQHENPGYYGDVEAKCQVFHICQSDGRHDSFLCPLGTIFNQQYFVCVWWFDYNCDDTQMYYALNADLYKGGQGHGNFKGDPYRGPADRGTDIPPPREGQASPGQGFGFGDDRPTVDGPPDISEQPFNGPSRGSGGEYDGENVANPQEAPVFEPSRGREEPGYGENAPEPDPAFGGVDIPQPGPGFSGQDIPQGGPGFNGQDIPQGRPGFSGPDIPQQGPGFSGQDIPQPGTGFSGQDIPQQRPGYGLGNSEQGPGYVPNLQQGIGYGQRGPVIPEQGIENKEIGQGNGGSDIQGGQGTDYGPNRGDWSQGNGGKRNWEGQDKRGQTDGNWRGGGASGNGVKGGWKSPEGSARGRKARSWGTHGLDKRWGSESENWISLEEAAEPSEVAQAFNIEPRSIANEDNQDDRIEAEDWESEKSSNPDGRIAVQWKDTEDGNDIWSLRSRNENDDIPSLRQWVAEPRQDVEFEKIAKGKEDGRSDKWLSPVKENSDIPKLRNWRTVEGPQKEIEFKNFIKDREEDETSEIWIPSENERSGTVDVPKSRIWRTVEENPKVIETGLDKSIKKNWWQDTLGGEEHKPKGRFARDTPHLFGGWRTLTSQFGHLNKNVHGRNWNR